MAFMGLSLCVFFYWFSVHYVLLVLGGFGTYVLRPVVVSGSVRADKKTAPYSSWS